jgi:hypothetical protein
MDTMRPEVLHAMAKALLEYEPPSARLSFIHGRIHRHGNTVAMMTLPGDPELGPVLAAGPVMKVALEAILEWDRASRGDVDSGLPPDLRATVHAALGLLEFSQAQCQRVSEPPPVTETSAP